MKVILFFLSLFILILFSISFFSKLNRSLISGIWYFSFKMDNEHHDFNIVLLMEEYPSKILQFNKKYDVKVLNATIPSFIKIKVNKFQEGHEHQMSELKEFYTT